MVIFSILCLLGLFSREIYLVPVQVGVVKTSLLCVTNINYVLKITPRYKGQPALHHRIESLPCAQWAAQNWAASKSTNLFLIGCNMILYHVGSMHIF